jgi:hypothetical protein
MAKRHEGRQDDASSDRRGAAFGKRVGSEEMSLKPFIKDGVKRRGD